MDNQVDEMRYNLTKKAREIARSNHKRKSTTVERAQHYIELVRDPEFLKFIKDLKTIQVEKIPSTSTSKTEANTVSKFETINVEQYKPFQWTNYIQASDELDDILTIIDKKQAPNILIEADKGVGKTTLLNSQRATSDSFEPLFSQASQMHLRKNILHVHIVAKKYKT